MLDRLRDIYCTKYASQRAQHHNDITTGKTTATRADIEKDIISHMLVPMYQGATQAAHKVDHSTTKAAGLADFAAYWTIIKDEVAFNAVDNLADAEPGSRSADLVVHGAGISEAVPGPVEMEIRGGRIVGTAPGCNS